jgi:asparagine synthase (glutamine-hydrolysing)
MFRTTAESGREAQPLATPDGDLVLTADVRVDNRAELIASLDLRAAHPEITDADLFLASYRKWGERCVEHWIGDFAIAIWDSGRQRLVCFRDPFGVKPFYYHHCPGRLFAFASEVEALLGIEEISDELDDVEVARHLRVPLGRDASTTYYRSIRRLAPAHVLSVTERDLETRHYWQLDPTRELHLSDDGEYAEALRETFIEAVRCRLRSASPVACMLSGGIDSASIACVAADLLHDIEPASSLHVLSAVYPGIPDSDERSFIQDVLEGHRMIPHSFVANTVNPLAEIDRMNRFVGGANWGANLYLNWMLYGVAADAGARVVLDGFDGDTTVSHGTGYLSELAMTGRWLKLALTSIPYSRRQGRPIVSDYWSLIRLGLRHPAPGTYAEPLIRWARGTRERATLPDHPARKLDPTINSDFARRFLDATVSDPASPTTEREFHLRKLNGMALFEGIGWLEACAAGRGVEVRLPFCDIRVAELCLSFPPNQKIRRGWTRFAMRRAMEGILPPAIQWRTGKANLHPGWASAYRSIADGRIEAVLANPSPIIRRYLDTERVLDLHGRFLTGETDHLEGLALWRAVSLALWLSSREDRPRSATRERREARPGGDPVRSL